MPAEVLEFSVQGQTWHYPAKALVLLRKPASAWWRAGAKQA
jgi:hypothetical protein